MARKASDRYVSVADFHAALSSALAPPSAAPPRIAERAIAVLPFKSLSPNPDDEFFATGLADEIITDLGRLRGLRVTARGSSARYKDSPKDARTVARELGVQFLLEGSVRRAGQSLRVIAELVDADRDAQLWSERFSGTLEDVFEIQEQIARQIVKALEVRLSSEDDRRLARRSIENVQAYELYLRARQLNLSFSAEGVRKGLDLVNSALALEPDSPPLLALKGGLVWNTHNVGIAGREALAGASLLVEQALRGDPNLGDALVVRAMIELHAVKVDSALVLRLLKKAVDAEAITEARLWLSVMLAQTGHTELAKVYAERGFQLDPFTATMGLVYGLVFMIAGDVRAALERSRATVAQNPSDHVMRTYLGILCATAGEFEEALRELRRAEPDGLVGAQRNLFLASLTGDREEVGRLVDQEPLCRLVLVDDQNAWIAAQALAHAGHLDRAMELMQVAMERGFCAAAFVRDRDHMLAPLRTHPAFPALIARMEQRSAEIGKAAQLYQ